MNVLVIYGGSSSERDISLMSGNNVGQALVKAGHIVTYFDPAAGMHNLSDALKGIDVVFPILHGTGGEDGHIQSLLEREGAVFVGSNSEVSRACFDKWQTIQKAKHIRFPKTELASKASISKSNLIAKPFVVKPRAEGSSVDTFIVHDVKLFDIAKLDPIFDKYNDELLLEEFIDGQELTVGVLGDIALPVVEIIPPSGQDFDFSNKYNGATTENCPPQFISIEIQEQAKEIALDMHITMGCKDFSRTDMIIDKTGQLYTLEINTLPGMTTESLFPRAGKAAGYDIVSLVDRLVMMAGAPA